jgi:hypothetical protein
MRNAMLFLSLLTLIIDTAAYAEPEFYGVGDRLPEIVLRDQHDHEDAVDASTRILLFSRDMDGGKLLQSALEGTDAEVLAEQDAVYLSDISGMPSLIARLFAVPSMRKRPYSMLLDRSGEATERIPDVEEKATVIFLKDLRIERIEHVDSADGVRALIGLDPIPD